MNTTDELRGVAEERLEVRPMHTEPQRQQTSKAYQNTPRLCLIAEEIRQTSQQLCEEAAVAQETAHDLVQRCLLAQQARKATHAQRVSRGRLSPP